MHAWYDQFEELAIELFTLVSHSYRVILYDVLYERVAFTQAHAIRLTNGAVGPYSMRVVSLLPSATEVLVASSPSTEDDDVLIGRSHECDYPTYVQRHPILTSAKNKFESCAQMNDAVCTSLSAGDSLYDIDAGLLKVKLALILLAGADSGAHLNFIPESKNVQQNGCYKSKILTLHDLALPILSYLLSQWQV